MCRSFKGRELPLHDKHSRKILYVFFNLYILPVTYNCLSETILLKYSLEIELQKLSSPVPHRQSEQFSWKSIKEIYIPAKIINPYQFITDPLISPRIISGEPGLVDRVLALHAGSRGFDSHRGHMSERFFRSNRPGYPHPVSSELEISGIRVAVGDCSVTERRRWRPPYQTGKTVHVHANTTNTTRTDARRRVCAAMVPYR